MNVFEATAKDDLTATTVKMGLAIHNLTSYIGKLTAEEKKSNNQQFAKGLRESSRLFASGHITVAGYAKALRDAGVSAAKTNQIIGQMPAALRASNKERQESIRYLTQEIGLIDKETAALRKAEHARVNSVPGRKGGMLNNWLTGQHGEGIGSVGRGVGYLAAGVGLAGGAMAVNYAKKSVDEGKTLIHELIAAARERQDTMIALKDSLQGADDVREKTATDLYNWVVQTSIKVPLATDFLVRTVKDLIVQGYGSAESKKIVMMVADQEAEFHEGAGHMLASFFQRIKGAGVATLRDFRTLQSARVRQTSVYAELAAGLGIKNKSEAETSTLVRKAMTQRKVSAEMMTKAVFAAHEKRHGGPVGTFAMKAQHSLTGAIINWENMRADMEKMTDITQWKGFQTFTDFLIRVQAIVTDKSGAGGRLLGGFESFTNAVFGGLAKISDTDIKAYLDTLTARLKVGTEWATKLWGYIDEILHADSISEGISKGIDAVKGGLWDLAVMAGEAFQEGIKAGLLGKGQAATDAGFAAEEKKGGITGWIAGNVPFARSWFAKGATFDDAYLKKIRQMGGDPKGYADEFDDISSALAREGTTSAPHAPRIQAIPAVELGQARSSLAESSQRERFKSSEGGLHWSGDNIIQIQGGGQINGQTVEAVQKAGTRGVMAASEKLASGI